MLSSGAAPVWAQRVVTQDAGGGRKIELHYNAANQVTETRTLDADGKLLEKDTLDYPSGALIPHSVATSYWPNGQAHKVTRNSYDNNSNFTGEFIQVFDESGKQIGGHRLTHYPLTNVYHCEEWNVAANDYKLVECPAGKSRRALPRPPGNSLRKKSNSSLRRRDSHLAPQKLSRQLHRKARRGQASRKSAWFFRPKCVQESGYPAAVVEDPGAYEEIPDVTVTRFAIPFASSGAGANLAGWRVELTGEKPQAADGPITLSVPHGATMNALFRQADGSGAPISKTVKLVLSDSKKGKIATSFQASPVCLKTQLCVVEGPFTGDSSKTSPPSSNALRRSSPKHPHCFHRNTGCNRAWLSTAGHRRGNKAIAFPMVVAAFLIRPPRRDLPKGENLLMYPQWRGRKRFRIPSGGRAISRRQTWRWRANWFLTSN